MTFKLKNSPFAFPGGGVRGVLRQAGERPLPAVPAHVCVRPLRRTHEKVRPVPQCHRKKRALRRLLRGPK